MWRVGGQCDEKALNMALTLLHISRTLFFELTSDVELPPEAAERERWFTVISDELVAAWWQHRGVRSTRRRGDADPAIALTKALDDRA